MDGNHLRADRRDLLALDPERRIKIIQADVWVDYQPSESIFRIINNIADVPSRITAPALLVTGPGGAGKTAIVKQIPHRVKNSTGLIFVDMAEDPGIRVNKSLRFELARAMGLPVDSPAFNNPRIDMPKELGEVIKLRKIWGIVIDELHDALLRNKQEQRMNMSILKKLLGESYGLAIIGFGTEVARSALSSNSEFKRRFHEFVLSDWRESEEFRAFLLEMEELIPLKKPSYLYSEKMVKAILNATEGRMDKTIELLKSSASYAIRKGVEAIDLECLSLASRNPWGY